MRNEQFLSTTGDMVLLVRVAQAGSIAGAGRATGLERTTVSRRISRMEQRLGVDLFDRSKREVRLTDVGKLFYQYCLKIVEAVEDGCAKVSSLDVDDLAPVIVELLVPDPGRFLADVITSPGVQSPGAAVEYKLGTAVGAEIDPDCSLAIRLEPDARDDETTLKLWSLEQSIWVSPECGDVGTAGANLGQIASLPGIYKSDSDEAMRWKFVQRDSVRFLHSGSRIRVNSLEDARDACVAGHGVTVLPDYMCEHLAEQNRLTRVACDWKPAGAMVVAAHKSSDYLPRGARLAVRRLRGIREAQAPEHAASDVPSSATGRAVAATAGLEETTGQEGCQTTQVQLI